MYLARAVRRRADSQVDKQPRWAKDQAAQLNRIQHTINQLQETIVTDQEHLDTDLTAALADLEAIKVLLAEHPAAVSLDFTGLDDFVTQLDAVANPPAPPAPTPA